LIVTGADTLLLVLVTEEAVGCTAEGSEISGIFRNVGICSVSRSRNCGESSPVSRSWNCRKPFPCSSVPSVRLCLAAGDSSDSSCRSSGSALFSFLTGMIYSASPSSATCTEVGRENRPPEDIRRKAEPVSSLFRLSCREPVFSDFLSVFVSARTFRMKVSENRLLTCSMAVLAAETMDDAFADSGIGFFASAVKAAISFFGSVIFNPIFRPV